MNFNLNEIVKIEQLPKVFEQLEIIGTFIDKQLKGIDDLKCTEENKQEVKNRRTEINNTLKMLEDKRKEIKQQINEPYDIFNKKYEETTKNKLESASQLLSNKINDIEDVQKKQKKEQAMDYFDEYVLSKNIDFLKFEDIGLNIILSISDKKLQDQVKEFVDRVASDLELIELQQNKEEILVEYKETLNLSNSIKSVNERHKKIEEEQAKAEIRQQVKQEESESVKKIDSVLSKPTIIEKEKSNTLEELEVSFKVRGSVEKLKELKKFLVEGAYDYESIN